MQRFYIYIYIHTYVYIYYQTTCAQFENRSHIYHQHSREVNSTNIRGGTEAFMKHIAELIMMRLLS